MDSLRKFESVQENPFLTYHDWQLDIFLPPIDFDSLIFDSIVYSPHIIKEALLRADYCLTHIPGPNLDQRIMYSETWLKWWIMFMDSIDDSRFTYMKTYNIRDFDSLGDELGRPNYYDDWTHGLIPAVWFAGGLEGNEGHRFALNCILNNTKNTSNGCV